MQNSASGQVLCSGVYESSSESVSQLVHHSRLILSSLNSSLKRQLYSPNYILKNHNREVSSNEKKGHYSCAEICFQLLRLLTVVCSKKLDKISLSLSRIEIISIFIKKGKEAFPLLPQQIKQISHMCLFKEEDGNNIFKKPECKKYMWGRGKSSETTLSYYI